MAEQTTEAEMEQVCTLPNGCALYRKPDAVGGHDYWSDEVGGGVHVWSTSLVDEGTLMAALTEERRRSHAEQVEKRHGKR